MKLEGRTAFVIGGADGLGRASAQACAAEGAQVMIGDTNEAFANEVVARISTDGGTATHVHVDATNEADVQRAVTETVRRFGGVDILVNSAGLTDALPDFDVCIDLFLKAPYYACKYTLPVMAEAGRGSVINISSISGVTGGIGRDVTETGYPAAKHGVIGLTRTLALAYAKKGIRVNAICPGYFRTGMTKDFSDGQMVTWDGLRAPIDRWGEPEEIGSVTVFLASDDSSFITGQPIIVDGGFMAR